MLRSRVLSCSSGLADHASRPPADAINIRRAEDVNVHNWYKRPGLEIECGRVCVELTMYTPSKEVQSKSEKVEQCTDHIKWEWDP